MFSLFGFFVLTRWQYSPHHFLFRLLNYVSRASQCVSTACSFETIERLSPTLGPHLNLPKGNDTRTAPNFTRPVAFLLTSFTTSGHFVLPTVCCYCAHQVSLPSLTTATYRCLLPMYRKSTQYLAVALCAISCAHHVSLSSWTTVARRAVSSTATGPVPLFLQSSLPWSS